MSNHPEVKKIISDFMRMEYKTTKKVYFTTGEIWNGIEGIEGIGNRKQLDNALQHGTKSGLFGRSPHPEYDRRSLWSLIEIEDEATKPKTATPVNDPANPAPNFAILAEGANSMAAGKPRQGTPEYDIAKQAEQIERLSGMLDKAISSMNDVAKSSANVDKLMADLAEAKIRDGEAITNYFAEVLRALTGDIQEIGKGNRRVEGAIRSLLEDFNRIEEIEDKAFARGFQMAMRLHGMSNAAAEKGEPEAEKAVDIPEQKPRQVALERLIGRKLG